MQKFRAVYVEVVLIIRKINRETIKKELFKIFKYQISGLAVIATDWGIYFTLNSLFGGFNSHLSFRYTAQLFSYTCGAVVSYAINRKWTFAAGGKFLSKKMFHFLLINLVSLAASEAVLHFASQSLNLQGTLLKEFATKVIVDVCTAVLNYAGIRFWIFREEGE